jgi:hypothetical protein
VFENRVLGKMLWASEGKVTEDWRKLHNEELYDLYCSPNIIWVIKSMRVRFSVHVASIRDKCA